MFCILTEAHFPQRVPGALAVEGEPNAIRTDVPASVLLAVAAPTAEVCRELDWTQGQLLSAVGLHDGWDIGDVGSQHSHFATRMAVTQSQCGEERHCMIIG